MCIGIISYSIVHQRCASTIYLLCITGVRPTWMGKRTAGCPCWSVTGQTAHPTCLGCRRGRHRGARLLPAPPPPEASPGKCNTTILLLCDQSRLAFRPARDRPCLPLPLLVSRPERGSLGVRVRDGAGLGQDRRARHKLTKKRCCTSLLTGCCTKGYPTPWRYPQLVLHRQKKTVGNVLRIMLQYIYTRYYYGS